MILAYEIVHTEGTHVMQLWPHAIIELKTDIKHIYFRLACFCRNFFVKLTASGASHEFLVKIKTKRMVNYDTATGGTFCVVLLLCISLVLYKQHEWLQSSKSLSRRQVNGFYKVTLTKKDRYKTINKKWDITKACLGLSFLGILNDLIFHVVLFCCKIIPKSLKVNGIMQCTAYGADVQRSFF